MEVVVKFNISDYIVDDSNSGKYTKCEIPYLDNKQIIDLANIIIVDSIIKNGIYYDMDDIQNAAHEILPIIKSIILNPNFFHLRIDYDLLVEVVTYLTIKLA